MDWKLLTLVTYSMGKPDLHNLLFACLGSSYGSELETGFLNLFLIIDLIIVLIEFV